MRRLIAARLACAAALYLAVLFVLMLALRVSDPAGAFLGRHASPDQLAAARHSMGLDAPFLSQYASFLGRVATLDFGSPTRPCHSWRFPGVNVSTLLADSIGPTLSIALPVAVGSTLLALAVGVLAASARSRLADRLLMVLAAVGMSVSVLALIVLTQSAIARWFPLGANAPLAPSGYAPWTAWSRLDLGVLAIPFPTSIRFGVWAQHCLAPVVLGVIAAAGADARFYRAIFAQEMSRPHIAAAVARGVPTRRLLLIHCGRPAAAAVVTRLAVILPGVVTGSLILESSFAVPGIGRLLLESILTRDFPVIQAITALTAGVFILAHLAADLVLARLDPRVGVP